MNEAEYQELLEISWRRPLTASEMARLDDGLAGRPDLRSAWEDESSLERVLDRLPAAPVPSNFTALVLSEARRQAAMPAPRPFLGELWHRLFPRPAVGAAWGVVMLCLAFVAIEQAHSSSQRRRNSELADFFKAAAPFDPALFQDFDAIQRRPQDEELLAVLSR